MATPENARLPHQLADRLRAMVRRRTSGSRLPTEVELCAELGASINKVREALTLLAQEGLVERRHGSGTYVAERLRQTTIGIFSNVDLTHPQAGPFQRTLAHYLRTYLHGRGVVTQLYLGQHAPGDLRVAIDCPPLFADMQRQTLAGLVVLTAPSDAALVQEKLLKWGIPVLGGSDRYPYSYDGAHDARVIAGLCHLAGRGCRRLALLGWEDPHSQSRPIARTLAHYRAALGDAATLEDRWLRYDLHPSLPGSAWDELREIWTATREKPDGLLICDDCLLPDAVVALRSLGVAVADQLQVAALTNAGISPAVPFPLTGVEIDPRQCAEEMGAMIVALAQGRALPRRRAQAAFRLVLPAAIPNQGELSRPVAATSMERIVS